MAFTGYDPARFVGNIGGSIASIGQQIGGAIAQYPGAVQQDKAFAQQNEFQNLKIQQFKDAEEQIAANPGIVVESGDAYVKLLEPQIAALPDKVRPQGEQWLTEFRNSYNQFRSIKRLEGLRKQDTITKIQNDFRMHIKAVKLLSANASAPGNFQTEQELMRFFQESAPSLRQSDIKELSVAGTIPEKPDELKKLKIDIARKNLAGVGVDKGPTRADLLKEKRFEFDKRKDRTEQLQRLKTESAKSVKAIRVLKDQMRPFNRIIDTWEDGPVEQTEKGLAVRTTKDGLEVFITQKDYNRARKNAEGIQIDIDTLEVINSSRADLVLESLEPGESIGGKSVFTATDPDLWTVKAIPITSPRIKVFDKVAKWNDLIEQNSDITGVDTNLIRAVINQESGGKQTAKSPKGAIGLMQVLPETARLHGLKKGERLSDPAVNVRVGTEYLRFLLEKFNGNEELVIAGYHSGEDDAQAALNNPKGNPLTHNYVGRVRGYLDYLRGSQPKDLSGDASTRAELDTSIKESSNPNQAQDFSDGAEKIMLDPETPKSERDKLLQQLESAGIHGALIAWLVMRARAEGVDFTDGFPSDPTENQDQTATPREQLQGIR